MKASMRPLVIKAIDGALKRELRGVNRRKQKSYPQSCVAVWRAGERLYSTKNSAAVEQEFDKATEKMGLEPNVFNGFMDVPVGKQRQQARALWLEWTKLMIQEKQV